MRNHQSIALASIVAVASLCSIVNADRGGHYSRDRVDASARYERGGSRDYSGRGDGRGYDRGYDRGSRYGGNSRGSFGFSFGYSSYSDSSYLGLRYSSGPSYYRSGGYYREAPVYVAPPVIYAAPPVIYAPPPVYYRSSYYAPSYYAPSYGGYYCR